MRPARHPRYTESKNFPAVCWPAKKGVRPNWVYAADQVTFSKNLGVLQVVSLGPPLGFHLGHYCSRPRLTLRNERLELNFVCRDG